MFNKSYITKFVQPFITYGFIFICFFLFCCKNIFSENNSKIKLGIDVLIENDFEELVGKRIILLTNYTGRTSNGLSTVEAFLNTNKCTIVGLMTPEHGYFTAVPAGLPVDNTNLFGLPVYSLYGNDKRPNKEIFSKCDAIVVDIQDIGVRSYTYISTLYNTMDAAAFFDKPIFVLDRPNPLGGLIVDGNIREPDVKSFVGIIPISYIHGCTIGELAIMLNEEGWLNNNVKCNLNVIKMKNWERWMLWEDTGLVWYPTSPHVPTINSVRGLAVLGIFGELGIISIGIGTTSPFQYLGSPDFKTEEVLKNVNYETLQGIQFIPSLYRPFYGMYNNKYVKGVQLQFPLSNEFRPYTAGFELLLAVKKVHPELFKSDQIKSNSLDMFEKVTGTKEIAKKLFATTDNSQIRELINKGLNDFLILRNKYLLYN